MYQQKTLVELHYTLEHLFKTNVERLLEQRIKMVTRKDIAGADEFHIRGAAVSFELASQISLQ
ncbi:hypothetical protein OCK74_09190 [Chitinophagaceae bacterium LB-8]|uniref:Uncharacterized protein n=1 Tax=Paraflavisolibacter caeni TaxID=2982496 RepID=A0A9X3B7I9_9BACT|nr:hypothetical protein [Paraflavisolibacter caeni]MCU7549290.1 hypothetical protein [Paraflavisolibacter caeni]